MQLSAFVGGNPQKTSYEEHLPLTLGTQSLVTGRDGPAAEWRIHYTADEKALEAGPGLSGQLLRGQIELKLQAGAWPDGTAGLCLRLPGFTSEDYVLAPAAAYNGNRFRATEQSYPPMAHAEDGIGPDMETLITDVPRLRPEGGGCLELTSGDMATPVWGVFMPKTQRAIFLYGPHRTELGYTGFTLREEASGGAALYITARCIRQSMYGMVKSGLPSDDTATDFALNQQVTLPFVLAETSCPDMAGFYRVFFKTRRCMEEAASLNKTLPFSAAFSILEQKYRESHWEEDFAYWRISPKGGGVFGDWQAGWVGGGINAYALAVDGDEESQRRSAQTFDRIFSDWQHSSGFIAPIVYQGSWLGDDFCHQERSGFFLVRKNADVLHFAAKTILLYQARGISVPEAWMTGIVKLAEAFARLEKKYGQIGQFADMDTEEIVLGGTASPGIALGGLALTARIAQRPELLQAACRLAEGYCKKYLDKGLLNGGPGEILQCPDSESTFGLLEGLVTLWEETGDDAWLPWAESCAHQASSWCMTYDFAFPPESEFGRLDMRTTGSVFANVQNKHSAPGICTLSPIALLELFAATGEREYLRLAQEIGHNNTQYLSREDRPIVSWDAEILPPGWMCERVNTSDWESKANIGGVFKGSCWCEISAMLTYNELPGLLLLEEDGEWIALDNIEVVRSEQGWLVRNPTDFPATVKLLRWPDARKDVFSGHPPLHNCEVLTLAPGEVKVIE